MTLTSIAQPNPNKAAEFARLFELFDRVATRRTRGLTGDTSRELISADDIASVPAEFAPVIQNVSTILSMRALRDEERARRSQATTSTYTDPATPSTIGRPRRNTVSGASPPPPSSSLASGIGRVHLLAPSEELCEEQEDPDSPTFPLDQRHYPFTFKLMLHKLYDMDEWVAKVQTAVETSKSKFKPLSERVQNILSDTPSPVAVIAGAPLAVTRVEKKRGSPTKSKTFAHAHAHAPTVTRYAHPHSPTRPNLHALPTPTPSETSRVVKKRCIGRRKSLSGPASTRVWVYDAAISAVDVPGTRPTMAITLFESREGGSFADRRARHQSLAAMEGIHARDVARRKVKIAVPLVVRENTPRQCAPSVSFAQGTREVGPGEMQGLAKRRRATMASEFDPEPFKRVAVKRPLCP